MNADKGCKAPADFMRPTAPAAVLSVTAGPAAQRTRSAMAAGHTSPQPDAPGDAPSPSARVKTQASDSLAGQALFVGEALIVLTAAALMSAYGRRRSDGRRGAMHARTSRRRSGDRINSFADSSGSDGPADADGRWVTGDPWISPPDPPRPDTGPPVHVDDYPSWPGRPGPYALHPDHPSWPGRPDPRWAATEAGLRADDYPSWPEGKVPPWRDAEPPGPGNAAPHWSGGGRSAARQEPPPAPSRDPRWPPAGHPVPAGPGQVRTDVAPRANLAPPRPVLRGRAAEVIDRGQPTAVAARPTAVAARPTAVAARPAAVPVRPTAGPIWDAGSVQLASWIISEANQHAAEIRHEARDQAATSLAGAKQEATQLVRQASDQAAATLAAAELEAADIRATVVKLSAELGGVAASVTQNLMALAPPTTKPVIPSAIQPITTPVLEPAAEPKSLPAARPAAKPGTKPAARPKTGPKTGSATTPGARPAGRPAARSARKPAAGRGRQVGAMRFAVIATSALFLVAVLAGVMEIHLHGFDFFIFRATGTGETGPSGLQENQGPGQPDAPRPALSHLQVQPSPPSTVATHNGQ
jgi:hypothetical protein